jgi:hypothetical protein
MCAVDLEADAYGDDAGRDVSGMPSTGHLLACNDLDWASAPASDDELFGATCGRRTSFGSPGFAGSREQLG